jgi:hypothetical protein
MVGTTNEMLGQPPSAVRRAQLEAFLDNAMDGRAALQRRVRALIQKRALTQKRL